MLERYSATEPRETRVPQAYGISGGPDLAALVGKSVRLPGSRRR